MYTEMFLIFFVRGVTRGGGGNPEVPVYPSLVGEMTLFDVNNILTLLARTLESKDA